MSKIKCIFQGFVLDDATGTPALKLMATEKVENETATHEKADRSFVEEIKWLYKKMFWNPVEPETVLYAVPTKECRIEWDRLKPGSKVEAELKRSTTRERPLAKYVTPEQPWLLMNIVL